MAQTRFPDGPNELLAYFEDVNREYPGQHWQDGAEMCRQWLQLITSSSTQIDIDQFTKRLDSEKNPGSGWVDLGLQFRHWARSRGFVV